MDLKYKNLRSIEDTSFEILKNLILKKLGLDCNYYRDNYVRRRIDYRMEVLGLKSYWDYIKLLRDNSDEWSFLVRDLTVNYTSFFRDPDVFSYFRTRILPILIAKKKVIRILSAGCSSGEEPYTISIIINDVLGSNINKYLVSIYAVDIDIFRLKKAMKGEYEEREVSRINKVYLDKYFKKMDGKYRVKECIKRLVHFRYLDLTQEMEYRYLDVIFCRNTFIYFSKEAQIKICHKFYDALNEGGFLIIGKSEILPEEVQGKFVCIDNKRRIYQKIRRDCL